MADDLLLISDLEAPCKLGVHEWERKEPQTIWIDLELSIDTKRAAERDDVKAALDYGRLVTVVRELAQASAYHLMETLAEEIAKMILSEFSTEFVVVRVKKRALPGIGFAAVQIERQRSSR